MRALEALMQTRHPVRVEPMGDVCWKGSCAKTGEGPLGLCSEHHEQLREEEL